METEHSLAPVSQIAVPELGAVFFVNITGTNRAHQAAQSARKVPSAALLLSISTVIALGFGSLKVNYPVKFR